MLRKIRWRSETRNGLIAPFRSSSIRREFPELIAKSSDDYEHSPRNRKKSANDKRSQKQAGQNRLGAPLFDTKGFTGQIEAAYTAMHGRHQAGLAPENISVAN
jgi:hypothetical protein